MKAKDNLARVRCRNQRCRSKLPIPTDNDHKAFCSRYCYEQFYHWRCKVCENPILKSRRRKQPNHCHDHRCRRDFRRYPEAFGYHPSQTINYGSRSAHFPGLKSAIARSFAGYQIIAGPTLSPPERISEAKWRSRDLTDAKYVAEDEARLRKLADDYPNLNWPPSEDGA